MSFALRALAMVVCLTGLASASVSSAAPSALPTHLSATASVPNRGGRLPVPQCGPSICMVESATH